MSWSPSIYRFAEGGDIPVPPDPAVVRDVLGPYTVVEPSDDEYWVRAEDGSEAEFFVGEYGVTVGAIIIEMTGPALQTALTGA
ncbi:hypothetical protein [Streptomyces acidiscabies]|uniref:hypothetical protein n=1 Tax=Streptomyces acidiscabies TaxID=42234 RepID=UPI00073F6EFF|nr:hypothetical protein [Streptomyces acidiscabies]GAQ56272.1 hypothetical protein a10_06125 [Streptomyces acidiscabies]